ncbi:hypothetical protein ACKI1I_29505 [Streptomyces turgidiscabies]|uniref:Chain length determinant protein n=1 Tax=Streptomyces turgidiscabies (strain Car8) TaxID=698760 RepID=L7F1D8_STRT8|nr:MULTISPECIES: hypothetical protein [Streptomyces]ELP64791.1 hypothetical protein STRTUCAR8_00851 [Streptomyces turgidiscabies Car8]MDX3496364.1 hypothetical protein [Streptomyces turgidiscabies]GAQ75036.1 hypothetical protein T45_06817 [Streptomyces turgidiscabies]
MSPRDVAEALLRRWYVLVLALLLTAAGAYPVIRPAPQYLSSAVVVLKPPVTGNQPNQLTNLQPPLATLSYGVIQQLESPAGRRELSSAGVRGTYQLIPRNSGTSATPAYLIPSLQVQARAADPAEADTTVRNIIGVYAKHVADVQEAQGISAGARINASVLVAPSAARVLGTKSRALAGTALLGATVALLSALWFDQYALRRRDRKGVSPDPRQHPGGIPVTG